MLFQNRLDRAERFQREQNGHLPEEKTDGIALDEGLIPEKTETEEKVTFREFLLMCLSAWAVILPVAVVVLVLMIVIARLLFHV